MPLLDNPPGLVNGPSIPGYDITEVLNRGGMGIIYHAHDSVKDCSVAVKVIRPDRLTQPEAVRRFCREVESAARLRHPHVARILDSGRTGDLYYLVMEYIDGTDLACLVKEQGRLPVALAVDYARQAAVGLQHLADHGLVHRDVKPGNLVLDFQLDRIKVVDLGLARLVQPADESLSSLTQSGGLIGTPDYVAPEQITSPQQADIRADLYSLGCTLYFLLAGHPPFPGGSMIQKLDRQRWQTPRPIRSLRADVPPPLAVLLARLLAKQPDERWSTAAEVAEQLASLSVASGDHAPHRQTSGIAEDATTVARVLDTGTAPTEPRRWLGHTSSVGCLAFSMDSRYCLSAGQDETIRLWNTGGDEEVFSLSIPGVNSLAWLPGKHQAVTACQDGMLSWWNLEKKELIQTNAGHIGALHAVAVSRGQPISAGVDQTIRMWKPRHGKAVRLGGVVMERHWETITSLACPFGGLSLLSGSRDGTVRWWDLQTRRQKACFRCGGPVHSVAISSDGRLGLWTGSFGLQVLDLQTNENLFSNPEPMVADISPTGRYLATTSEDQFVRLWDIPTGRELRRLAGHEGPISCLKFSTDGSLLAAGCLEGPVCLWRLPTWFCQAGIRDQESGISSIMGRRVSVGKRNERN